MKNKKIEKAEHLGTCFGVERALEITYNALEDDKHIYCYGDLIHNNDVKKELENKGLIVLNDVNSIENEKSDKIIFRSHGVSKSVYEESRNKGLEIIDATCPKVKKIHKIVQDCYNNDYTIILFGNKDHPELIGIKGWCNNEALIFQDLEDFKSKENQINNKKFCVVFQTTYNLNKFEKIKDYFERYENIRFHNTICSATFERQNSCRELAKKCDTMIVIGGKHSSNTKKLYEISKEFCENTFWIENKSEIPYDYIKNSINIGITAGASTPLLIIEEVIKCLKRIK
ncbi:MAG: 4-hydroxy-3-methylbut-2-enyl diphosphate reductase [Bacillota bacterium]|nr:4-hydroxy-3-methylbut-2-enyl diphosphate reductase [Bacillota bacterium]